MNLESKNGPAYVNRKPVVSHVEPSKMNRIPPNVLARAVRVIK
jgi:hypothetical protein